MSLNLMRFMLSSIWLRMKSCLNEVYIDRVHLNPKTGDFIIVQIKIVNFLTICSAAWYFVCIRTLDLDALIFLIQRRFDKLIMTTVDWRKCVIILLTKRRVNVAINVLKMKNQMLWRGYEDLRSYEGWLCVDLVYHTIEFHCTEYSYLNIFVLLASKVLGLNWTQWTVSRSFRVRRSTWTISPDVSVLVQLTERSHLSHEVDSEEIQCNCVMHMTAKYSDYRALCFSVVVKLTFH